MERINKWCLLVLVFAVCLFTSYHVGLKRGIRSVDVVSVSDTLIVTDTILFHLPVAKDSVIVRYETVKVPVPIERNDSAGGVGVDSAEVELPIENKVYADSTYRAWVSGYRASLDSILVYPRSVFVTEREVKLKPPNRWGVTLTAGAGYVPGVGLRPSIGIGISYTLLPLKWK